MIAINSISYEYNLRDICYIIYCQIITFHKFFDTFTGELADAIATSFGSFDNFKAKFSAATIAIQGSGWGWLVSTV